MIENTMNNNTHQSHLNEVKITKSSHVPLKLQEIFKCIDRCDLGELNKLLEGSELTEKSINNILGKAFSSYKPTNETSKDIIASILR
jgi:hypothetical protein